MKKKNDDYFMMYFEDFFTDKHELNYFHYDGELNYY